MARQIRKVSKSDIYHVILRGVNKQRIFEQKEDYEAFFRILDFVKTKNTEKKPLDHPSFFLYAYCLMDNHVHLLIQPNGRPLGDIMKRIMTTYAIYFNNTYERIGHLFQDRFKSEPVESCDYFFTLLHYIHNNPVKAGICQDPSQYRYSSWRELANMQVGDESGKSNPKQKRCEKGQSLFVSFCNFPELCTPLEMDAEDHRYKQALLEWNQTKQGDKPLLRSMNLLGIPPQQIRDMVQDDAEESDISGLFEKVKQRVQDSDSKLCQHIRARLDWQTAAEKDQAIISALFEMTGVRSITEFQRLDKPTMRTALALVRASGVGDTRLSRLTGISRGVILRAQIYPKAKTQTEKL